MEQALLHLVAIVVHQGVSDLRQVLNRIFRLIVFDWDGTAVLDRNSPAPELVYGLEGLLQQGVVCAIVTGTKLEAVERQCTRYLSPRAKKNLFVCTNRGSEVYGFSAIGQPTALMRWTERRQVRKFQHYCGDVCQEILNVTETASRALLVIEWKGVLLEGHANILKHILRKGGFPLFLVRMPLRKKMILKVGNAFWADR